MQSKIHQDLININITCQHYKKLKILKERQKQLSNNVISQINKIKIIKIK